MTTEFKKLPDKQPGSRKNLRPLEHSQDFKNPVTMGTELWEGRGEKKKKMKTCLSAAASGPSLAQTYWEQPKTQPTHIQSSPGLSAQGTDPLQLITNCFNYSN